MARQRAQWTDATAGMSSDEYFGPKGSFWDCKSIDPTLNAGYALISSIQSEPYAYNSRSTGGSVGAIVGTSYTSTMAFGADGVYENAAGTGGANTYTVPGSVGYTCLIHKTYGVLIGKKSSGVIGVYRWIFNASTSDGDIGVAGANITEACSFTQAVGSRVITIPTTSGFYIGTGSEIWLIDTTTGTWGATNPIHLESGEDIIAMTDIGDQIVIYVNTGSGGKQYYYSKAEQSQYRTISWYDRPFINVANINNIDYAFTGTDQKRQVYIASGYQPQLVKTSIPYNFDLASGVKRLFFNPNKTNNIETMTQRVFVPDDQGNIYSIGNVIPGLPTSVHKQFTVVGSVNTLYFNELSGMFLIVLFQSTSLAGSFKNYFQVFSLGNSGQERQGTAYITRNKFYGPYQGLSKQSAKIKHTAKLLTTNESVYLSVVKDSNFDYVSAFTGTEENFYTTSMDFGGIPVIGDVYTGGGLTWKVVYQDVTLHSGKYLGAVSFQITSGISSYPLTNLTLTRSSGTGPATLKIRESYFGLIIDKITGTGSSSSKNVTVQSHTQIVPGDFKEIQISQFFVSTSVISSVTQPSAFGEVTLAYDTKQDDMT